MTDQPPPPPPEQPPPYPGAYGGYPEQPSPPYDPRWGYGPPGVPYGMPQHAQGEDTTWALLAYLGNVIVGFFPALIIYLVKKNTSPFTRFHAAQSMNFQLTLLIHLVVVAAVCVPFAIVLDTPALLFPLIVPYLELIFGNLVFTVWGAVKAGKREYYRFPTFFCFRMIR